ncbi:MAG: cytochrome C oxidase subunit II [Dehalococcoidia bacterium]
MSVAAPERIWWKPLGRDERLWVWVSVVLCIILFTVMVVWHLAAPQTTPRETYAVTPERFTQLTDDFVNKYKVREEKGLPVVQPPAGGDAYLQASTWQWSPILELKKGQTYRIHLSSKDLQHGFSLQPLNYNLQILPGYDYVMTLTPQEAGEYRIVCNEYCGIGHHLMVGKLIVTE